MPSIPSAWEMRGVGTRWEVDGYRMNLRQDLAPPARTEWRLSEDVPEAIMWEPRFRGLQIESALVSGSGTHLLSLLKIPDVMRNPGLEADECIFIFMQHQGPPPRPPEVPIPGKAYFARDLNPPPLLAYEAETLIFEVPAKEEAQWQLPGFASVNEPDPVRLQTLLRRAREGTVTVAGHALIQLPLRHRATCRVTEDYMTATEFDPPELPNSPRMRPTALETLPVGSRWSVEIRDVSDAGIVYIDHTFEHSTARPVEPPLAETLAIARRDSSDHPGAVHHQERWQGQMSLPLGQPLCLGPQKPPGVEQDVRHVAFMRVRKL